LLRGSRDGFTSKKFHTLCDNKYNTVTFFKVKGTEEILGGYNPLSIKSSENGFWGKTKDSFIFSFKNKDNFISDVMISNIEDTDHAIYYGSKYGPDFGDIIIKSSSESVEYSTVRCRRRYYEKNIRDTEDDNFTMEDYEVFQIIKR
jgi:hypothetical protein